jgi:hypothetical protein
MIESILFNVITGIAAYYLLPFTYLIIYSKIVYGFVRPFSSFTVLELFISYLFSLFVFISILLYRRYSSKENKELQG